MRHVLSGMRRKEIIGVFKLTFCVSNCFVSFLNVGEYSLVDFNCDTFTY